MAGRKFGVKREAKGNIPGELNRCGEKGFKHQEHRSREGAGGREGSG